MALSNSYNPPRRRKPADPNLPKFTYGLEGKLLKLIGEPIALAHKVVRPKFEQELSTNEGTDIRYTYTSQYSMTYIDYEAERLSPFLWKGNESIFHHSTPTYTRRYNFRVDLWENGEGKFSKFSFALEVA